LLRLGKKEKTGGPKETVVTKILAKGNEDG